MTHDGTRLLSLVVESFHDFTLRCFDARTLAPIGEAYAVSLPFNVPTGGGLYPLQWGTRGAVLHMDHGHLLFLPNALRDMGCAP
jgi:hypothetical protein